MTRLLAAVLLVLCCLLSHPATSQVPRLAPLIVTLDSGTVVRGRLIGLDTATYRAVRVELATGRQLLSIRSQRIETYVQAEQLHEQTRAAQAAELQRCRQENVRVHADFDQLSAQARKTLALPLRRALLLDSHTYAGAGIGALALLLLKLSL